MKKVISVLLIATIFLTGCGTTTLEAYVKKNDDVKNIFKALNTEDEDGMVSVVVEKNTIYITSTYKEKMSKDAIANLKKEKEKDEKKAKETFQNLIVSLEESTDIEEIKVAVKYQDENNNLIYEKTYE